MTDHDHITMLKAATTPQRVAVALGLQGRGSRFFCPLCQPDGGKSPDLVVGDEGFICHECGETGDVLRLIEVTLNITFPDALKWLENHTGIERPGRRREDKGQGDIVRLGASSHTAYDHPINTTVAAPDPAVYEAFLSACRPVDGPALDWLTETKYIAEDLISALGLRFCGREYVDIMNSLLERFEEDALRIAGLLKKSKSSPDRLVLSFYRYYAKDTGFLVIPYLKDGRPVYLKVRPPMGKEEAERLGLPHFMNTATAIPCLYNVDALKGQPDNVLICEGESDTWAALSCGFVAVGSPGAWGFKSSWVEDFRGFKDANGCSTVHLVTDADKAGGEGERVIANLFLEAGLPIPRKLILPPGLDLTDCMKGGMA